MVNHAQITRFAKPQVNKSRGFSAKTNHGLNHANHGTSKNAGQEITRKSRQITRHQITNPTVPVGDGGSVVIAETEHLVARNRTSARQAGAKSERAIADYLAAALNDDRVDRRVKRGVKDRGDISGLRIHGQRLVIEVKDCARVDLPGWTTEAHLEAGNDDALTGVVVAKRRGTTNPGKWWVHMTVDDLLALLTGQRHGHRAEDAAAS